MRKPEQLLYDAMKRNKPDGVVLERVENIASEGMPDVYVRFPEGPAPWVELKATLRPKRDSTPLMRQKDFEPGQVAWHKQHCVMGHDSWVLVRDEQRRLYLVFGREVEMLWTVAHTRLPWEVCVGDNWSKVWGVIGA